MKNTKLTFYFAFLIVISGCDQGGKINPTSKTMEIAKNADKNNKSLVLEPDLRSPDTAVKSWWRYIDYRNDLEKKYCNRRAKDVSEIHLKELKRVANIELIKETEGMILNHTCIPETYDREIQEVKVESETRAIVIAKIKNSTPIPPDAKMDKQLEKWRAEGSMFKYLLEKDSGDWKVSRVYQYEEANKYMGKEDWGRIYEDKGPSIPVFAGFQ